MKKDLYVATSLEDLQKIAAKDLKKFRANRLFISTEKVFESGLQYSLDGDEEKAYILLYRFMTLYEFLKKHDEQNTKRRLGNKHKTCFDLLDKLKSSLETRYNQCQENNNLNINLMEEQKMPEKQSLSIEYPDGFMSCSALYELIKNGLDMLIFDVRSPDDYSNSCLKATCSINIPEGAVTSGLSAYQLGKKLPPGSQAQYERRQEVPLIVMLDWSTTRDMIAGSKLAILKDILVNWDLIETIRKPPVIVDGGYLEVLQMYPILCANPKVVYTVQNNVLEELLDIDAIEYPSTDEPVPISIPKPTPILPIVDRRTKPTLGKTLNIKKSEDDLIIEDDQSLSQNEDEYRENEAFSEPDELLPDTMSSEQANEVDDVQDPLPETQANTRPVSPLANRHVSADIQARRLKEAREKKKPLFTKDSLTFINNGQFMPVTPKERLYPKFNRNLKPMSKKPMISEPGVTGLKNFGTTCYMSAVVQCLSNTRQISFYFCESDYLADINRSEGKGGELAKAFGTTLQMMWSGQYKSFLPKTLKAVLNQYTNRYNNREHQDAHEFLILFVNFLHDDLLIDSNLPRMQIVCTPKDKTWLQQTNGKCSIIIDTFCGQIRSVVTCEDCGKRCENFDIFQNLTLHLPPGNESTLEKCMELYFSKQLLQGFECPKCKSRQRNYQTMYPATLPHVLVIALKRFSTVNEGGTFRFVRNNMSIRFPVKGLDFFNHVYDLYAVINHLGTIEYGHYTAICKNPLTNKWHKFDDDHITEVCPELDISSVDTYLLFYQYSEKKTVK